MWRALFIGLFLFLFIEYTETFFLIVIGILIFICVIALIGYAYSPDYPNPSATQNPPINQKITPQNINASSLIRDYDTSKNETASMFRQTVEERGREVYSQKVFLFLLDDYRVTKDRRYIKDIIQTIGTENLWPQITAEDSSYATLESIKKQLITRCPYNDAELTETLAYIGYGLNLAS